MPGQVDYTPMVVLLSVFVPLGTIGVVLGSIGMITYYLRTSRRLQIGGELVQQMLQRDMSADEIERVLLAWHGDPSLAGKLINGQAPLKKFVA
jgi:hypothetical protein